MNLIPIILVSAACLIIAYYTYGSLLARLLKLDDTRKTPAHTLRDDLDYKPTDPKFLMSQHFSAIAAAGPIVGPILAGVMFGWLPALLWVLVGSIFIGGVHDLTALVASVRHKARSIAEVVNQYMSRRSYILFLLFIWIALVYIVVAFTDIVASSFVGQQELENGLVVTGPGIASSSLLYLILPVVMGLLLRFTRLTLNWATAIFLPLVGVAIWAGQYIPLDLAKLFNLSQGQAVQLWDVLLLGYCFVASIVPVWSLLQPRGHLGGYFLYACLGAGALGILLGDNTVQYPAFVGWTSPKGESLFPALFITVACGACSGFHCLIASGTTSKQLHRESDAKPIGYGAMLLEAMVAVVSLGCLMILSQPQAQGRSANFIYARGIGSFLEVLHIPAAFGISFGLLAFTTFVYDTLDVCTRLGRYILQELTGFHNSAGRWITTAVTTAAPLFFLLQAPTDSAGNPVQTWKAYWPLFGASNQLLAALALLGVTVWLRSAYKARWIGWVLGLPTLFMYTVSVWALLGFVKTGFFTSGWTPKPNLTAEPVPWAAGILVVLAVLVLLEAVRVFRGTPPGAGPQEEQSVVPAAT